ncbi:probable glycosyltransferase STELLO1 [Folsomia candida]|uniref:probable glycosyltransferase STELLO1 n=1 Tax=Folsomia candida TaxID=158441 RepID=UPI0016050896|nr:probable glycosyltransferase STELLO1 [Folsomia candida]
MKMLEILKIYIESNRKYIIIFALVLLQIQVYLHITRSDVIYEQQTQFLRSERSSSCPPEKHWTNLRKKWIVVTSISHPTEQVIKLSRLPEFQLVVVADQKTPKDWTLENAIILSTEKQLQLGYNILQHIPWNAYTRKMIGYLFAIQHGAEIIYDTDDDNVPNILTDFDKYFAFGNTTRGFIAQSDVGEFGYIKNPYVHFGQRSVWPRGYPVELVGSATNNNYTVCRYTTPVIQQGLVNGDPDVDAIFRLTRKKMYKNIDIQFDGYAPQVVYPKGILAPFNSQNTLFHYDSFWALMLPVSVAFRVTDIWRGYWAQPLLWKIGKNLAFTATNTTQVRNAHNYLKDFAEENKIFLEAGSLVKFLAEWKCSSTDLYNCMVSLTEDMVTNKFWDEQEVSLVKAWILDLNCVGYTPPVIVKESKAGSSLCVNDFQTYSIFNGITSNSDNNNNATSINEKYELRKFCNFGFDVNTTVPKNIYPETLLVITFNFPHYEHIWLLELIYRPYFPNILYCGDGKTFKTREDLEISFVHANVTDGWSWYECALRAIDMNYGIRQNYIFLSDDVVFEFWKTEEYDKDEIWGYKIEDQLLDVALLNQSALVPQDFAWEWNRGDLGRVGCLKALTRIANESAQNELLAQFVKNRGEFGLPGTLMKVGMSDIFQLPRIKEDIFYEAGRIVRESEILLEMAVPLITTGISSPEKYVTMPGIWIWNEQRSDPFAHFKKVQNGVIFHPIKFSSIVGNQKLRKEYCDFYIKYLL